MSNKIIILLFILGFLLRLSLSYIIPYPSYPEKLDDAHQYDVMALNILQGNGFSQKESAPFEPTICRTPIYPIFLASIFGIFGHSYTVVYIVQALMSALTALMVYLIALNSLVDNKKQAASLAYLLAILCPFLWFSARMLYTEVLFTFLVTLLILLIIYTLTKSNLWLYFISGIITGLALLTRPAFAPLPIFLFLTMIMFNTEKDKLVGLLKKSLIYVIPVVLIWSTWVIRNYMIFNKFIPLSVASGSYLYLGTFSPNRYEKDFPMDMQEWETYLFKEGDEILSLDEEYRKKGIERIKEKPLTYIKYSIQRIPVLWISSFSHYFNIEDSMAQLRKQIKERISQEEYFSVELMKMLFKISLSFINVFYVSTGILGIVLLLKYWRNYYPLLIIPFYFTFVHMFLGQANVRYVLPAWPILIIFSAVGLLSFKNWIKTYIYRV